MRLLLCCLFSWQVMTQSAAGEPPPVNLLQNPGFEGDTHSKENLWGGVNSDGVLAGFPMSAEVVLESGHFGGLAMPPSVAFVDLNGDGKPALITADPLGYFRFFPNNGSAAAPRFTRGELLPIYLSGAFEPGPKEWKRLMSDEARRCPRFALADWRHSGLLDLLVGNYFGEVLFLPNVGTARQPAFRQPLGPDGIASARLATSEKGRYWGNLLSPAALDLNHDGHLDLLVGEGTYSANSIHLLRNLSNGGVPKFNDANHFHIAYGDGREQLIPTVVDYDGDGQPDLLVADRTGEVSVYLNPGKSQPPGAEFKRVSTLGFGAQGKLPGLCSLFAADFNGDGLFDLIVGLPSGHIGVALNSGTKANPRFGPVAEIKGEDYPGRNINLPAGWEVDTSIQHGNALGYFTVVDARTDPESQPPEGAHCLKAGYWPLKGATFQVPPEGMPGAMKHFVFSQGNVTLQTNKPYEVSFLTKGSGMEKLRYRFSSFYRGSPGLVKIERGERGGVRDAGAVIEEWEEVGQDFSLSSNWSTVTGTFNVHYKHNELRNRPTMTGTFSVEFWATSLSSAAYFDDLKIIQK